jgi:hypothetical protein
VTTAVGTETEQRHFPFPLQRDLEPLVAKRPKLAEPDYAELEELRLVEAQLTATVLRLNEDVAELQGLLDRAHHNYDILQDAYNEKANQVRVLEREAGRAK